MSKYEIVRMPTDKDELQQTLEEFAPFLDAMYTDADHELFGEPRFILDHWLYLWDTGAGCFLTKRNEAGDLLLVAMITLFRDLWHAKTRLELIRISMAQIPESDAEKEVDGVVEYLVSISSLLRFDLLYYNIREPNGNEHKMLLWKG